MCLDAGHRRGSLFAALSAIAVGAIVIAATSTEEKANRLHELSSSALEC